MSYRKTVFVTGLLVVLANALHAQTTSLNGEWKALIDPAGVGDWRQVWLGFAESL
jgi:beta-glucuronidase